MSWPTPQDYNEAIQTPAVSLTDAQLQRASPALTHLGLPRPITGNFASVYRMEAGARAWAVRCFWRDLPDTRERYALIGRHLESRREPCLVPFTFIPRGILVRGVWYPLIKMPWLEGQLLHEYVQSHHRDRSAISNLRSQWVDLVHDLHGLGISHGDLQHGNILVVNGRLRLVDYDGMYVPALAGRESHEIGHSAYQHPARTARDFGPHLDRFSALVIYVSLLAVEVDPTVWDRFGGEDGLLFQKSDFARPHASSVLSALGRHADGRLRDAVAVLVRCLHAPLHAVPSLSDVVPSSGMGHRGPVARSARRGERRLANPASNPGMPDWLYDHLSAVPGARHAPAFAPRPPAIIACFVLSIICAVCAASVPHGESAALRMAAGIAALTFTFPGFLYIEHSGQADVRRKRRLCCARVALRGCLILLALCAGICRAREGRGVKRWTKERDAIDRRIAGFEEEARRRAATLHECVNSTVLPLLSLIHECDRLHAECELSVLTMMQANYLASAMRDPFFLSPRLPAMRLRLKLYLRLQHVNPAGVHAWNPSRRTSGGQEPAVATLTGWKLARRREAIKKIPRVLADSTRAEVARPFACHREQLHRHVTGATRTGNRLIQVREQQVCRDRDDLLSRRETLEALHRARNQRAARHLSAWHARIAYRRELLDTVDAEMDRLSGTTFRAYIRHALGVDRLL
ncbi:MAG: hypothetical protein NVS4B2_03190 [Chloroflexota bacterium]